MKKLLLIILAQILWAAGFSQSLPLNKMGTPFRRPDLDVRWNVPTNALPPQIWGYRIVAEKPSSTIIANLMQVGSFTDKDKVKEDANELSFKSSNNFRSLEINFHGKILFQAEHHYGPTNMARDVPKMNQMPKLTEHFLPKLGIEASDIAKNTNGAPDFNYWEPFTEYYIEHRFVTNVEFRAVSFKRALNGFDFVGNDGQIFFGEHGQVSKISLWWPKVERDKLYSTATPETIIKWMRNGKAVQGRIQWDSNGIYWPTVKSVTVKKAEICYLGTENYAYPIVALWTTIDTGHGNIDVEIDCPIIDEAQP
jgi:hypothetical protein